MLAINNDNKLKLGLFNTNTTNGFTLAPDVSGLSWPPIAEAARQADRAGLEAIVALARWKGYVDGEPLHRNNLIFDSFTLSSAIAAITNYSTIFATVHTQIFSPVIAARIIATIDHVSRGRFGLNVVGGWNKREFDMVGVDLLPHEERYPYLQEWLDIVRRLSTGEEFDCDSKNFRYKAALIQPPPLNGADVPIMNAGSSEVGMRFAARNADISFCFMKSEDPAGWKAEVDTLKDLARNEFGREISIWGSAAIIQRDTREEAMAYADYLYNEKGDTAILDSMMDTSIKANNWEPGNPLIDIVRRRLAAGGGLPLFSTAEDIADRLEAMSDAGLDGVMLSWIDYETGLPRFIEEVLPILERKGLRKPFHG